MPFCVSKILRGHGIGRKLCEAAMERAKGEGFTSCISMHCGGYFRRFRFLPARDEFGLELYFDIKDEEFLACELSEGSLYRKSGFLIFPPVFSKIDPVMIR
jgi:predicted N-acetyltransferase YhbS